MAPKQQMVKLVSDGEQECLISVLSRMYLKIGMVIPGIQIMQHDSNEHLSGGELILRYKLLKLDPSLSLTQLNYYQARVELK